MKKQSRYSLLLTTCLFLFTSCNSNLNSNTITSVTSKNNAVLKLDNEFSPDTNEIIFTIDNQTKSLLKSDETKQNIIFNNLPSNKDLILTVKTIYNNGTEKTENSNIRLIANKINGFTISNSETLSKALVPIDKNVFDEQNRIIPNGLVNGDGKDPIQILSGIKHYFWFEAKADREYIVDLSSKQGDVDLFGNTDLTALSNLNVLKSNNNIEITTSSEGVFKLFSGCYTDPTTQSEINYNNQKVSCKKDNGTYDNVVFNSHKEGQRIYLLVKATKNSKYNIKVRENVIPKNNQTPPPVIDNNEIDFIYVNGINTESGFPDTQKTRNMKIPQTGFGSRISTIKYTDISSNELLNDALLDLGEIKQIENGYDYKNAKTGFLSDLKKIKQFLGDKDIQTNANVKGIYNPTSQFGIPIDLFESLLQKCSNFEQFESSLLINELEKNNIARVSNSIRRVLDGIKLGIKNSILIDNRKVIVIAHSQGNLFVNQAIKELLKDNEVSKILPQKISILGLGSPNRAYYTNINTVYISNLFDMVTWLDGIDTQTMINNHNKAVLEQGLEPFYTNTNTASNDPSKLVYSCNGKDKIIKAINNLALFTNTCSNQQSIPTSTNIISKTKIFGSPFSSMFFSINVCNPSISEITNGPGLGDYHFLNTGYIGNEDTNKDIIRVLKEFKSNLIR